MLWLMEDCYMAAFCLVFQVPILEILGIFRLEADDGILFADGECCEGWIVYFSFVFFFWLRLRPDKRRVVYQTAICACFFVFPQEHLLLYLDFIASSKHSASKKKTINFAHVQ